MLRHGRENLIHCKGNFLLQENNVIFTSETILDFYHFYSDEFYVSNEVKN